LSKTAALLGGSMGLSGEECLLLLHASPMHDVGKIGIPDQILFKPGPLSAEERKIIETHTTIGSQILGDGGSSPLLRMARDIAENHHEKWDGTGYPHGLSGDQISLPARIVSILDVFDALVTERPYKEAWSMERAIELIQNESGRHFDPMVVASFMNTLDEILSIYNHFTDD